MGDTKGYYGKSHHESVMRVAEWLGREAFKFSLAKGKVWALIGIDHVVDGIHLTLFGLIIDDTEYVRWQFSGSVDKKHVKESR